MEWACRTILLFIFLNEISALLLCISFLPCFSLFLFIYLLFAFSFFLGFLFLRSLQALIEQLPLYASQHSTFH